MTPRHIIISRTDSIGDVILTFPLLGLLKKQFPDVKITFLGQNYTRPVIVACSHVDFFLDWSEMQGHSMETRITLLRSMEADVILHVFPRKEIARLAHKAGIPVRMGTTGRIYHWLHCNHLIKLSRKNSPLHEAFLNILLAEKLIGKPEISNDDIPGLYGFDQIAKLPEEFSALIDPVRFNLILHPKSKGSAREWGTHNFAALSAMLPRNMYKIFVTGTKAEGDLLIQEGFFDKAGDFTDLTGKMSLEKLISFIKAADGLIAASTGPLHIAAALGKTALGIYPPIRPMHPGRWAPIGKRASFLVSDKECSDCAESGPCRCMLDISPKQVQQKLFSMVNSDLT
ncbi:MAG: glycosyltransferase family 9 protein [Bacteroidales bacterium]|nr:glycosyltransferase family 9 protein [Bacteroidales bacterium]